MDFKVLPLHGVEGAARQTLRRILELALRIGRLTMTSLTGEGMRDIALKVADVVTLSAGLQGQAKGAAEESGLAHETEAEDEEEVPASTNRYARLCM